MPTYTITADQLASVAASRLQHLDNGDEAAADALGWVLTAEPTQDTVDAKRWRFIAQHWHSVHVSFNKKPNTLKLMRLTVRTDYTKPRERAEAIEREIDTAIAKKET
jgi:hypothetical protein